MKKNLKKLLSLVLSLVLTMSLCIMPNATETETYTDEPMYVLATNSQATDEHVHTAECTHDTTSEVTHVHTDECTHFLASSSQIDHVHDIALASEGLRVPIMAGATIEHIGTMKANYIESPTTTYHILPSYTISDTYLSSTATNTSFARYHGFCKICNQIVTENSFYLDCYDMWNHSSYAYVSANDKSTKAINLDLMSEPISWYCDGVSGWASIDSTLDTITFNEPTDKVISDTNISFTINWNPLSRNGMAVSGASVLYYYGNIVAIDPSTWPNSTRAIKYYKDINHEAWTKNMVAGSASSGSNIDYATTSSRVTIPLGHQIIGYNLFAVTDMYPLNYSQYVSAPQYIEFLHVWDTAWTTNDTHHWHECTGNGECFLTDDSQKDSYGEHAYTQEVVDKKYEKSGATTSSAAVYYKSCVCGKFSNAADAATFTHGDPLPHQHNWDTNSYDSNDTHHWYKCTGDGTCDATDADKQGLAAHTYDQQVVNDTYKKSDATYTSPAIYYKSCVCGHHVESETAAIFTDGSALPHDHNWSADWNSNPTHHWHECTGEGTCTATTNSQKDGYTTHTYDQTVVDAKYKRSDATYTSPAIYYKSCVCGKFSNAEGAATFTDGEALAHGHNWSADWTSNPTHHWHECTGEGTCTATTDSQKDGYTTHTYNQTVVDAKYKKSDATYTSPAIYYKSCVCGRFSNAEGAATFTDGTALPHVHNWSTDWTSNPTHHWHECTGEGTCTATDNSQKNSYAAHTYDQQVVNDTYKKSDATYTSPAIYYKSCVCGKFSNAEGATTFTDGEALAHVHNWSTDWTSNPTHHWHECTGEGTCTATTDNQKDSYAEHVYNNTVVDPTYKKSDATYTSPAIYYKSCVCGKFSNAEGAATFTDGSALAHVHNWSADWNSNPTHHWHECTGEGTCTATTDSQKGSYAEHVYDKTVVDEKYNKSPATYTSPAIYYKSCVCGHHVESETAATFTDGEALAHVHNWDTSTWGSNDTHHWHNCTGEGTCTATTDSQKGSYAEHVYDKTVVDEKYNKSPATYTSPAIYYKSCVCGHHVESETAAIFTDGTVLAHVHNWDTSTWQSNDTHHWHECTGEGTCTATTDDQKGSYAEHVYDKTVVDEKYNKSPATYTSPAVYYKSCVCGKFSNAEGAATFTDGTALAHVHNWDTSTWQSNDTHHWHNCTGEGTCTATTDSQKDSYAEHVYNNTVVDPTYKKSDATYTSPAIYYKSCVCGKFSNAEGAATFESGSALAHVHNWDTSTWQSNDTHHWHNCTGEGTCTATTDSQKGSYAEHVYDKTVVDEKYNKSPATYTSPAIYYKSCVCGKFSNAEGATTFTDGTALSPDPTHTHSWSTEWSSDETTHWHECVGEGTCDITNNLGKDAFALHTYDRQIISEKYKKSDATDTHPAVYYQSCSCGAFSDTAQTFTDGNSYVTSQTTPGSIKNITQDESITIGKSVYDSDIVEDETYIQEALSITETQKQTGVNVWLDIKDVTTTVPTADKELVDSLIISQIPDSVPAMHVDANLYMQETGQEAVRLTETIKPITVTLTVPDSMIDASANRQYRVIRVHSGAAEVLDSTFDATTKTITFVSDKFSIYTITYTSSANTSSGSASSSSGSSSARSVASTSTNTASTQASVSGNWGIAGAGSTIPQKLNSGSTLEAALASLGLASTNTYVVGVDGLWHGNSTPSGSVVTTSDITSLASDVRFALADGNVLANTWALLGTTTNGSTIYEWYHFGADGILDTGWYLDSTGHWYYLSEVAGHDLGKMQVGWRLDSQDGRWYYLDTRTGAMLKGWQTIGSSWYYFTEGTPIETWEYNTLLRKWSYKNIADSRPLGSMYIDETTPDGYVVGKSGTWG